MNVSTVQAAELQAIQDRLRQSPPSISQQDGISSRCLRDVIITSEFQRREAEPPNASLELAAFKHLANHFSSGPFILFHELATVLVQICDAGSAGITFEERRLASDTLQRVGTAGRLASEQLQSIPRHSPCGFVIDNCRAELFRRPGRFYGALCLQKVEIEELLVVPWQLSSGRRGAIWLAHHDCERHFSPEHLRLVTDLSEFARHAFQRSLSEETRRSSETLASAARVANQLAHEVNNPLQALINSLYLCGPETEDRYLAEAQAQAERLAALVRSVLQLKRQQECGGTQQIQDSV